MCIVCTYTTYVCIARKSPTWHENYKRTEYKYNYQSLTLFATGLRPSLSVDFIIIRKFGLFLACSPILDSIIVCSKIGVVLKQANT